MDKIQKETIRYLRGEGFGYKAIATRLELSENTVKGFCKRNGLGGVAAANADNSCRQCGAVLIKKPKSGQKKFCSDKCRNAWWRSHPHMQRSEKEIRSVCAYCGDVFYSFQSKNRKYCNHACSMNSRYGEGRGHDTRAI